MTVMSLTVSGENTTIANFRCAYRARYRPRYRALRSAVLGNGGRDF